MRMAIAVTFLAGVVVAALECRAPLFPWLNLGGVAMMCAATVAANMMEWE